MPSESSAIPEPTTMVAGALVLLPFGASTLRILRRRTAYSLSKLGFSNPSFTDQAGPQDRPDLFWTGTLTLEFNAKHLTRVPRMEGKE